MQRFFAFASIPARSHNQTEKKNRCSSNRTSIAKIDGHPTPPPRNPKLERQFPALSESSLLSTTIRSAVRPPIMALGSPESGPIENIRVKWHERQHTWRACKINRQQREKKYIQAENFETILVMAVETWIDTILGRLGTGVITLEKWQELRRWEKRMLKQNMKHECCVIWWNFLVFSRKKKDRCLGSFLSKDWLGLKSKTLLQI